MNIDALKQNMRPLEIDGQFQASEDERGYFDYYNINFSKTLDRVTHHFGYIQNNDNRIACHFFENTGAERTAFVMHGMTDHVGLFQKLIAYFLDRGCNVVAFDLPGHGLSSGKPLFVKSFGDYVIALQHVIHFFKGKTVTPWHITAQSMGGAITMEYLLTHQGEDNPFENVVLLAPLVRPAGWYKTQFLHFLARGFITSIKRKFKGSSHDTAFTDFVREKDYLQAKRIPLAWVTAMIVWSKHFKDLSWSERQILVVQGDGDAIVDWRYNQKMICEKFPKARYFFIKDAKHHLVGESEPYFEKVTQAADIYFERRQAPR